jgi:hypothetical protein
MINRRRILRKTSAPSDNIDAGKRTVSGVSRTRAMALNLQIGIREGVRVAKLRSRN